MSPRDDLDLVAERIADLVADRLAEHALPRVVTAAELANFLRVDVSTVYENADALGCIRIGDGPRPRLRFVLDADRIAAWQAQPRPAGPEPRRSPARPRRSPPAGDLLPIRGRAA